MRSVAADATNCTAAFTSLKMSRFERACLAVAVIALLEVAWLFRFEPTGGERPTVVLDRWLGVIRVLEVRP